jgi:glycosyltransferase involved in cell wall biosynthesis
MNILVLQETDWLTRGPHTQHHVFERLSKNPRIDITVLDYDIEKTMRSKSLFIKKQNYHNVNRAVKSSNVKIIRTAHIQIPYLRRISSLISNFFEVLKIIRKNRPDIITGFSITNGSLGLLLAKLFKIPYIFYCIDLLHTLIPISSVQGIAKIITRLSFKNSDQVIVVTKLLQNYAINEGSNPQKVKILLNGISLDNTEVNENKLKNLKSKFSLSDDDFVLLFMGFLYDFAGLKEIIDYYHEDVKKGKYNLKFLILGDGGIYNNLIPYVKEKEADWVILAGRVPFFDVTEYIQLSDLCILSFKLNEITKEITPVKVMEYMAMKKPVLSNSLPGVLQEIGENNGVIFAKNQEDLIIKIGELISKKPELAEIGQRGYNLILRNYVWSEILKDFKKIMLNLIKRRSKK